MAKANTRAAEKLAELEEAVEALAEDKAKRDAVERETPHARKARETRDAQIAEIWENLERLGGKQFHDTSGIVYEGTQIKLPADMSVTQARQHLERVEQDQERQVVKTRTFNYRPWDGAWCMWNVMQKQFGAAVHRGNIRFGFFGPMEDPPQLHTI